VLNSSLDRRTFGQDIATPAQAAACAVLQACMPSCGEGAPGEPGVAQGRACIRARRRPPSCRRAPASAGSSSSARLHACARACRAAPHHLRSSATDVCLHTVPGPAPALKCLSRGLTRYMALQINMNWKPGWEKLPPGQGKSTGGCPHLLEICQPLASPACV
jgi:hypothetical protein